jgi:hypothetical protein
MYVCMYVCVYVCISSVFGGEKEEWVVTAGMAGVYVCVCMFCVCMYMREARGGRHLVAHVCVGPQEFAVVYVCMCVCMCMYVCMYMREACDGIWSRMCVWGRRSLLVCMYVDVMLTDE